MKFKEAFEKCQAKLKANKTTGNHLPGDTAKMVIKDKNTIEINATLHDSDSQLTDLI